MTATSSRRYCHSLGRVAFIVSAIVLMSWIGSADAQPRPSGFRPPPSGPVNKPPFRPPVTPPRPPQPNVPNLGNIFKNSNNNRPPVTSNPPKLLSNIPNTRPTTNTPNGAPLGNVVGTTPNLLSNINNHNRPRPNLNGVGNTNLLSNVLANQKYPVATPNRPLAGPGTSSKPLIRTNPNPGPGQPGSTVVNNSTRYYRRVPVNNSSNNNANLGIIIPLAVVGTLANLLPPPQPKPLDFIPAPAPGPQFIPLPEPNFVPDPNAQPAPQQPADNFDPNMFGDGSPPAPRAPNAVQITEVYDGPAQKAGFKPGDIILAMNKHRIRSYNEFVAVVKTATQPIAVVAFNAARNQLDQYTLAPEEGRVGAAIVDIEVDLNEGDAEPTPIAPANEVTALRITEVSRGPAARAGLQVGDIILGINGKAIRNTDDLVAAIQNQAEIELAFFNPDDQKAETRRITLQNGTLGLTVEPIAVATTAPSTAGAPSMLGD